MPEKELKKDKKSKDKNVLNKNNLNEQLNRIIKDLKMKKEN